MGHTEKTEFNDVTDWVQIGDLTEVYSGTVVFPADGQPLVIEFDTPFDYNDMDNLVVAVNETQPGFNCSIYFGKTGDLGAQRGIYARSDSENPDPNNPPAAFETTDHISTMILGGIQGGCGVATVPYTMDFESATPPDLPECTSRENAGSGNDWETTVYNDYGLSGNVLMYKYNTNAPANAWFYTQGVEMEAGVEYQISYKFYGSEYWPEKMKVAYGASPEATAMTEQLADYPEIGQAYDETVSFTVASDGVYYFGFNAYSDADRNRLYLDDIRVIVTPTCVKPTDLLASTNSNNAVDLSWTAGDTETEWLVNYGATGFDPSTEGQEVTVNTDPQTTITGLDPNTVYDFYVTAICGVGDESEAAGPVSATTACDATNVPYVLDFEEVTVPAIPECTRTQNVGSGNNWDTYNANSNGFNSNVLRYAYDSNNAANAWFYTQGLNLEAGTEYRISYKYGNNSTNKIESMKVVYGTSPDVSAMTETLADHPEIANGTPSVEELDFTVDADGVYYFGFNVYSDILQYYLYVDDISIIAVPSCEMPSNLSASNLTSESAKLSWTAGQDETQWEVLYGVEGFNPSVEGTLVTVNTDPETTITGLNENFTYEFYVTAICGTDDESEMAGPGKFTTPCNAATVPYVMDFETATPPNLPECTSRENLSNGNTWITTGLDGFGFDSKVLFYDWSPSNDANVWFYTQGVTLMAGIEYQISYLYGNDNSYDDTEKLKVAYGAHPEATAMTNVLADHPQISSGMATEASVTFTPDADGVYYFGFNAYSDAGNYRLFVDDINIIDTTIGIEGNDFINISYFPNPVKDYLTITAAKSIENVSVYNLLGQKVMDLQPSSTEVVLDFSSLPTGTYVLKANAVEGVILP